ncbi:sugar transferase [Novosphingobium beihaiensis]|uniref:Sugar transferase n=1 Tax=Novosphingobium beihaiensis TaxID=2930389 RepID=A0ABT0BPB5_9SPHN|nr:sugar transferase [Novosphingobium beihaiensis]MCJ2186818.1 sugar transferase [Novosphingobium beihaiensis]
MDLERGAAPPDAFAWPADRVEPVRRPVSWWESGAWRGFDIVLALLILIAVLPFLVLVTLVLFVSDPGPVFFVHRRIGYRGRYFNCLKFRTMKVDGDAILRAHLETNEAARREWEVGRKLRKDPRVTPVGAVMRKLSLDEFPQLINVLMGDMSMVGPRPIVDDEVACYGSHFPHYCLVRPGLTGLWQTSGRSDTSFQQRVEMDLSYIARKSLALDAWLLCKTVPAVVMARGSY